MKIVNNLKDFLSFFMSLFQNRYVIKQLVKRDFQNKYLGSFVGLLWVFIQPTVYIFVLWFVLVYGLKTGRVAGSDTPYYLWFITGVVPWMFISELLTQGTNSILEYSFLIKKVVFRSSIIPLIKIITSTIIHLFFILLLCIIYIIGNYYPTLYWFQLLYYLFAAIVLLTGFAWLLSSLSVFVKDIPQIVNVIVQILFWATPILWYYKTFPDSITPLYKFNPFFYIIQGYRDSFFNQVWFWEHKFETIYFWIFSIVIFIAGSYTFRRLKPHFADVL